MLFNSEETQAQPHLVNQQHLYHHHIVGSTRLSTNTMNTFQYKNVDSGTKLDSIPENTISLAEVDSECSSSTRETSTPELIERPIYEFRPSITDYSQSFATAQQDIICKWESATQPKQRWRRGRMPCWHWKRWSKLLRRKILALKPGIARPRDPS
jgi:hypothetical protein